MTGAPDPGYGGNRWALWRRGLRDRLAGRHAQANARWGHVRAPAGESRLIWIKAGGSADSLRLAVDLTRAVRDKRLDVRIVLTFETDLPALWQAPLRGLRKVAVGYGPCDAPRAVRRVLRAFQPLGVVLVDTAPTPVLAAALQAHGIHSIALNSAPIPNAGCEAVYPRGPAQRRQWATAAPALTGPALAPAADFLSQLVEAQVDPNFRSYLCGGAELALWWVHGDGSPGHTQTLRQWWCRSGLARDGILFVSGGAAAGGEIALSQWQRQPVAAGSVLVVDDDRWLPAVAASARGTHLFSLDRWPFWQALAAGTAISVAAGLDPGALLGGAEAGDLDAVFSQSQDLAQLEALWTDWRHDSFVPRARADAARRLFWGERRLAARLSQDLLQRIFDW